MNLRRLTRPSNLRGCRSIRCRTPALKQLLNCDAPETRDVGCGSRAVEMRPGRAHMRWGPLNPQERASARGVWRMALCATKRRERLQQFCTQTSDLLDHLVGAGEQRRRNG